jgi:ABC-type uncharacterized transport system involved in gliding motility auxiliary subunit
MSETEAELISSWLDKSGRLLVLSDALKTSGLESVLESWGVQLRNDVVLDPARTLTGREVFVDAYNRHPITAELSTTAAIFSLPRSVTPAEVRAQSADRPRVTPLALSSSDSWAESHPEQSPAKYDPLSDDRRGPLAMAVAVEKGSTNDDQLDVKINPSRLVIFGDSTFVSNGGLTGGDVSLFMSSLNWLLNREELMGIAPKTVEDTKLNLTRQQFRTLSLSIIWGIPGVIAVPGFFLWARRRK